MFVQLWHTRSKPEWLGPCSVPPLAMPEPSLIGVTKVKDTVKGVFKGDTLRVDQRTPRTYLRIPAPRGNAPCTHAPEPNTDASYWDLPTFFSDSFIMNAGWLSSVIARGRDRELDHDLGVGDTHAVRSCPQGRRPRARLHRTPGDFHPCISCAQNNCMHSGSEFEHSVGG